MVKDTFTKPKVLDMNHIPSSNVSKQVTFGTLKLPVNYQQSSLICKYECLYVCLLEQRNPLWLLENASLDKEHFKEGNGLISLIRQDV